MIIDFHYNHFSIFLCRVIYRRGASGACIAAGAKVFFLPPQNRFFHLFSTIIFPPVSHRPIVETVRAPVAFLFLTMHALKYLQLRFRGVETSNFMEGGLLNHPYRVSLPLNPPSLGRCTSRSPHPQTALKNLISGLT